MKEAVRRLEQCLCIGVFVFGLIGCAGISKPEEDMASAVHTIKQQFAGGQYRQSLQGCQSIIDNKPSCQPLDEALYYAALNSMRLDPDPGAGKNEAAQYLGRLVSECPNSPYRPEAELWLAVLTAPPKKTGAAGPQPAAHHSSCEKHEQDSFKKKDQEIKRLRSEILHLNREINLLKKVDVQLYEQKKDLDNGPDEGKNTRP